MLDSGSDRDIIAMELAKELELSLRARSVTIQTVESNTTVYRYFANLRIEAIDETYGADVDEALVGSLLTSDGDLAPAKRGFDKLPHAQGIHFADVDAKVQMMLGVAHAEAWIGAKIRRGDAKLPSFLKTAFGWTAVGGWSKGDTMNIACYASRRQKSSRRLSEDIRPRLCRRFRNRSWRISGE